MRAAFLLAVEFLCLAGNIPPAAAAHEDPAIGVAQFPGSLHPDIGSQTTRFYTVGLALRPITATERDGKLACLLCAELPTLENGLARREERADGRQGLAVKWLGGYVPTGKETYSTYWVEEWHPM